ncbi:LppU/SCO3897 family protein [Spirillospora sp. CA-128828]|uniref:LppU/SCO3897 family protein n=1 Tax=Spirillospora sp. CA-128828 TaxID=3240033 RepID=UPI003D8AEFAF
MITASVMILSALVGVPVVGHLVNGPSPEPGDCLEAKGRGGKTGYTSEFRIVSCTAPTAAYKVAMFGGHLGCDDNTYGETSASGRTSGRYLCLMLNAKVGDCFYQEVGFPTGKATKVPCGPSATYRVVAVIPGKAHHTACGPDVNPLESDPAKPLALVYPRPPLTICTTGI